MRLSFLALAVVMLPLVVFSGQTPSDPLVERARRLLRDTPVIDGHNDYPWEIRQRAEGDLAKLDLRVSQPVIMTDLPRLKAGGVGGQFWSVYVPSPPPGTDPATSVTQTLEQIDVVHRMVARYPDALTLALTADDIERAMKQGRIASLIGMEGGHSINSSLPVLRMMYRLGARYMTLTHGLNVPWADSATDSPKLDGLSPFGEQVIQEMNRLGMLIDLSHVSPATMSDAIKISTAPVIFSHSSARALTDVPRNVPDDILRELPRNGGVVMVTFVPGFVSQEVADWNKRETSERTRLTGTLGGNADAITKALEDWRRTNPAPRASVIQVADHVDHVRKVAGIDHVGLGSDFDGITSVPVGLEDVSTFPLLLAELLRRGYSDADVRKIASRNILRVMRAAEATAARVGGRGSPGENSRESPATASREFSPGDPRPLIVALGDSTTAGTPLYKSPIEAPPAGSGNDQSQFAYWLMQWQPGWSVLNRGVNGERSDQIAARFDRDVLAHRPAAVIIIAGVNDVYQGRPVDHVLTHLRDMYDRAAAASIPVIAGSIVPYNTATAEQNRKMHEINAWIANQPSRDRNIIAVDTRKSVAAAGDADRLAGTPDGLHPDITGYKSMADALLPAVTKALTHK
ncbi:MAG TPA: membrane dipeptidase [Vicinamibacterales bacterium]|nr:membrane dipeptidase [Vicinamibacterales bacterium]